MSIKLDSSVSQYKPINYNRKECICSCTTRIINQNDSVILNYDSIKYEVKPNNGDIKKSDIKKISDYKRNYVYWGYFKNIIELPKIFENINDDDYCIHVSNFYRDKILMPFVDYISIKNIQKYEQIITKENRKQKLSKIIQDE